MSRSSSVLSLAVAAWLLAALLAACKSNSTNPGYGNTGGGGGGGAAPELNGNLPASGGGYSHMFNTAGTFNYHCTIHPGCTGLAGTIVVVAPGTGIQNRVLAISQSGGTGGVYATCSALSVSRDTVQVGDTVTWTNNSPVQHTVVSE
jgi:plastocyanin